MLFYLVGTKSFRAAPAVLMAQGWSQTAVWRPGDLSQEAWWPIGGLLFFRHTAAPVSRGPTSLQLSIIES